MTHSATGLSKCARKLGLAIAGCALLGACASSPDARSAGFASDSFAGNGAITRVSELNLRRDPIPPILIQARKSPYALYNTGTCERIGQEMALLTAVLGEDYDTASLTDPSLRSEAGGEKIVEMLVPFSGVVREISGANRNEWEFRQAISAGLMRRAYLKGRGEQMGCPYPARPYPAGPVSDPTNFEDLGDPPPQQQQPADPRRMVRADG